MIKKEIKNLIIIVWNLHQKWQRNVFNEKKINELIDKEVENYLKDNESNNN